MAGNNRTHNELPVDRSNDTCAREKQISPPPEPGPLLRQMSRPVLGPLALPVPPGVIAHHKNQHRGQGISAHAPPETHGPVLRLHNEARERRAGHGRDQVDGRVHGEGLAALVQEVDVGQHARGEDLRDGAKDAGDGPRRDKGRVVGRPVGHGRPDGRRDDAEDAPEGARHGAEDAHERDQQHGADDDAGEDGGNLEHMNHLSQRPHFFSFFPPGEQVVVLRREGEGGCLRNRTWRSAWSPCRWPARSRPDCWPRPWHLP